MALRPYFGRSLFDEMADRAFDRHFFGDILAPSTTSISTCPVDFVETPESYVLKADAPGMDKGDIKLEVRGNRMTLSGERKEEKREEEGGFTRYERSQERFSRSVQLPKNADAENIQASLERGVLSVTIPKKEQKEEDDVKHIEIN